MAKFKIEIVGNKKFAEIDGLGSEIIEQLVIMLDEAPHIKRLFEVSIAIHNDYLKTKNLSNHATKN